MSNYGQDHRDSKSDRIRSNGEYKCEVTGSRGAMESHHNAPKCFNGPDSKGNSLILVNHFHSYLHQQCNVKDPAKFSIRIATAKELFHNPLGEESENQKQIIREIDAILIPQYVFNLLTKFHGDIQSTLTMKTVERNMETIRDLTIENMQLKAQLEVANKYINRINRNNNTTMM